MKEILFNLALIDLNNFCKINSIDYTNSHLIKNGRGFKYSLVNNNTNKTIVSVLFTKSSTPIHYVEK